MEKKRIFDIPEAIIIKFNDEDIIRASGPESGEDPDKEWEY